MIPERFEKHLDDACQMYDIESPERVAAFLAQVAHESAGFTRLEEDLNYGPARLLQVFPRKFTAEEAVEFAHDAPRIAERVYGGRLGNGPEGSGDAWKFRGRGLIQLTGRANYRKAGRALGVPLEDEPEKAADPLIASLVAAWYWAENGCNELADAGRFDAITRAINGGMNGYEDRVAWHNKVKRWLS